MKKLKPNNTEDNKGRDKKTTKKNQYSGKKQTAAKEGSAKKSPREGDVITGGCLDLGKAGEIVLAAAGKGHQITDRLGDFLLSSALRDVFQQDVLNMIKKAGCDICVSKIPNEANNTLEDVMIAIQQESYSNKQINSDQI